LYSSALEQLGSGTLLNFHESFIWFDFNEPFLQSAVLRLGTFVQAWNGAEVLENQVRVPRVVSNKQEHECQPREENSKS
jgi:hypothetical protein